jgi:GT2 family glycosyltransferase
MKLIDLSIIIVSWQVRDLLKECLASIFLETKNLEFEVIVMENASRDQTVEMVAEFFPKVAIISSLKNLGFGKACNLAVKQARGRYLLFLNPDTVIINQAIEKMVKFMEAEPQIGISGCKILNRDLTLQPSVRKFPQLSDHLAMLFKLHHLIKLDRYFMTSFDYQQTSEVDQVMGAFFLVSRRLLKKVGVFDERFYIWFEEVDYCIRCKQAGFNVVYTPVAEIIHLGGQSFSQKRNIKNQWNFCQSRWRFVAKHQGNFAFLLVILLTPVSLLISLIKIKLKRLLIY